MFGFKSHEDDLKPNMFCGGCSRPCPPLPLSCLPLCLPEMLAPFPSPPNPNPIPPNPNPPQRPPTGIRELIKWLGYNNYWSILWKDLKKLRAERSPKYLFSDKTICCHGVQFGDQSDHLVCNIVVKKWESVIWIPSYTLSKTPSASHSCYFNKKIRNLLIILFPPPRASPHPELN